MSILIFAFSCLALLTMSFLLAGIIINVVMNKGFLKVSEVVLLIGTIFTVFILGMVVFTGQFIIN